MGLVVMSFVASCRCGDDGFYGRLWVTGFYGRLWVTGFNVVLCLVVVVAVADGVGFLWPIVWVGLLVFVAKRK